MERLMGLAGMVAFIAFAYALSHNRKAIHWRTTSGAWGSSGSSPWSSSRAMPSLACCPSSLSPGAWAGWCWR